MARPASKTKGTSASRRSKQVGKSLKKAEAGKESSKKKPKAGKRPVDPLPGDPFEL
jgi:hypothetical protein